MAFPRFSVRILCALSALVLPVHSNYIGPYEDDVLQPVTSDETVSVGGTVILTCRVAESDNSSLQWTNTAQQTLFFGEKRALKDSRIQLHKSTPTELSITISEVQLSDEGEYTCSIFTMPVRTARATVTVLGVPGKPVIMGNEDPVEEGKKLTLTCNSTGSKPPAKLRWFRGDQELEGRPNVVESNPGQPTYTVSSELTLTVTKEDHNAHIACVVDHPSIANGDKRTEQSVNVWFSPSVKIQPVSDLPREGEKFHLQCLSDGNPEATSFWWEKKEGELPPLVKEDGSFLRFETLNKTDNGIYVCSADNGIGKKGHAEFTLVVQDAVDTNMLFPTFPYSSVSPSSLLDLTDSSSTSPSTSFSPTFYSHYPSFLPSSLPPYLSSSPPPSLVASDVPPTSELTSAPASSSIPSSPDSFSTPLSNILFPDLTAPPLPPRSVAPSSISLIPSSVPTWLNGVYSFTEATNNAADPTAMSTSSGVDHAVIGGVVAVIVFIMLCLLIVLGRYLIRHKGTYLTHEAKGSDDAPDADTAIINAEGGQSGADDRKEYFI